MDSPRRVKGECRRRDPRLISGAEIAATRRRRRPTRLTRSWRSSAVKPRRERTRALPRLLQRVAQLLARAAHLDSAVDAHRLQQAAVVGDEQQRAVEALERGLQL